MKKLLFLLIAMVFSIVGWGQNIFFEGFETGNTQATAIAGWTQESVTGTSLWLANTSSTDYNRTPRTGSWNAYIQWSNTRWMFKSATLTGGVAYKFSVWARQDNSGSLTDATIALKYGTTGTAAGMTNTIAAAANLSQTTYQQYTGVFTPATSGVYYLGILGYMNGTPWYISIDDISLDVAVAADAAPTTFTPTLITQTGMTIGWTDNSMNETKFRVYRSTDNITFTQSGSDITSTSAASIGTTYSQVQTGLLPGVTYYYRIAAVLDAESPYLTGNQVTSSPGNIVSTATGGKWSATTTWVGGVVPGAYDNVTIVDGAIDTIDNTSAVCYSLTVGQGASGVLTYIGGATAATLTVNGDVTIAANAIFDAGTGTGTKILNVGGTSASAANTSNIINNGVFDMNMGTAFATVNFYGSSNSSLSGGGATFDFYAIVLNKGINKTSILDVMVPITMSSPAATGSRLTLTAGSFKMSSASTLTPWFANQTICAANARLWLNNASASMTCVGTGTATGAGSPTVTGELLIDNGTFGYGSGNNTLTFTSGSGILTMNGGVLNMFGAIAFPSNASTTLNMTGGNIYVDPQAANNLAVGTTLFSIGANTTVNWSGGNITIIDPNATTANTAWSASSGGTKNITGGTLKIGDGISTSTGGSTANTSGFGITSSMPVWNLEINTGTVASRQARISGATSVLNNLTIQANGYLFLGSGSTANTLTVTKNVINNGTLAGCESGGTTLHIGTLYLNGTTGTQNISGTGSFTNLSTLSIANTGSGVSISNAMTFDRVNLFYGSLDPSNLTIGSATVRPSVQIGSGVATFAAGTFTTLPTFNYTFGYPSYFYALSNAAMTTGLYNEMPVGNPMTVYSLYNSNTNGLTIDRSFQIDSVLTLAASGANIFMGANNLTLGKNAVNIGLLSYTGGSLVTSGGTFTRWFPIAGLPTTISTGIGYFPMAVSLGGYVANREVKLAFSSATALTTGGSITCAVAQAAGLTTGLSIADTVPAYIINRRSNSSWTLTPNGIVASGTIIMRAKGTGVMATSTYANIRLVQTTATGKYLAGTGTNTDPEANRSLLTVADLANPFYMGAADTNMSNIIYSAQTGDWNAPASWAGGVVPTSNDAVVILNTHNISVTDAQTAYAVLVNSGGNLTASAGTLTVVGASASGVVNNAGGLININGGTLTIGPAGGGNRTFSNYGSLTVANGTLNINGNFYNSSSVGNIFTQSGGNINVDANAAGVIANSVGATTNLVTLTGGTPTTLVLTAGTFTIVDPPAYYSTSYYSLYGPSTATNCGLGHTFRFGDGVSTDRAGYGFYVYSYNLMLGNVIVNGSAGMDRFVQMYSSYGILGNVTINSGGDFRTYSSSNYLAGNITNNSGGILTNANTLTLASYAGGVYGSATTAQTISGAGSFRNILPTATIGVGGTGYVVGDILTIAGGTYTSQAKFLVTAVTTGAVSSVIALGNSNYSVLPTSPVSTIGGTGTGCTLNTSSNLAPTANLLSLTVNNNSVSGVTIGTPLSVSGTLTLTAGIVNTTATNILTLGTPVTGTLSGGSATAFINGPFARVFPIRTATGNYSASTLYPVGKSGSYLPLWIDPTVVTNPLTMSGEAYVSNDGTGGAGVTFLSQKRWEALVTSGLANFTGSYIQLGDTAIVTGNQIIQSASAAGVYNAIVPASVFTLGTPNTVKTNLSQILAAAYSGYFAYGNLTPCTAPLQPTALATSYNTSTGFVGTITAPAPAPSNYLVVRYPVDSLTLTTPVNYTTYTVGNTLGAGKIVSISGSTTFTETTLVANTTYTYYIFGYNNSGCYGPVYNITSPLQTNVTTCATAVGVPGTPSSSLITVVGFNAKWTSSITAGATYLVDVATDAAFTSFVSGYNAFNNGTDTSINITALTANSIYYLRLRAYDATVSCYSNYTTTLIVTTECEPLQTYPWSESFESTVKPNPIALQCWRNSSWVSSLYGGARTGTLWAYSNTSGSQLRTPGFRITAPSLFSYWYRVEAATNPQTMNVILSTDGINYTDTIAKYVGITNATYLQKTLDLTPYIGQNVYIRFDGLTGTGGGAYGICVDDVSINPITAPTVTTTTATAITGTTATAGGVVTDNGLSNVTARGVCYSTNALPTLLDQYTSDGSGNGAFTSTLTSMGGSTLYHYRAYATNVIGTSFGGDSTFTTLNVYPPQVSMDLVSTITDSSATASGTVISDGGNTPVTPITMSGFVRSTTITNPLIGQFGVVVDTTVTPGMGAYSVGLTGLTQGTLYYVNAFATNSIGTAYGFATSFTTIGITTTPASAILPFSATTGGNITTDGGNAITARGVCFDTATNPTILNTYTTDGSGMGSFVSNLTLPTAGTKYYIRAYATNALGTFYGANLNFTTLCDPGSILSTTGATRCGSGRDTLKATITAGSVVEWFADSIGGAKLDTGNIFLTPIINSTKTYYAGAKSLTTAITFENAGKLTNLTGTGFITSPNWGIVFNTTQPIVVNTATIYPIGTGDVTIALLNSAGTELAVTSAIPVTGTGLTTPNVINLGFAVPVGSNFKIVLKAYTGITNMLRESSGNVFPYVSPSGAVSVTGGWTGSSSSTSYYWFYNLNVQVDANCTSVNRIPVIATVTPAPALTLTGNDTVCNTVADETGSGVIVTKQVTSTLGDYASYVWTPIDSLYTDAAATIPYTTGTNASTVYFKSTRGATTTYTCSATNPGVYACANTATTMVTVRPAPAVSLSVSLNPICAGNSTTLAANTTAATYAAPPAVSSPTSDEDFGGIVFGSLNNTSVINSLTGTIGTATGTPGGYSDFTAFGPYNYTAGSSYPMILTSLTTGSFYDNAFGVYIDYNHNGVFTDAGEAVYLSAATVTGPHTDSTNITIPATALNGLTRMRVINNEGLVSSPTQSISWGEYEEYTLNITGGLNMYSYQWTDGALDLGTASSITQSPSESTTYFLNITEANGCVKVIPTTIIVSEGVVIVPAGQPVAATKCEGETATFNVTATGVGLTYQWRKNGIDITTNATATTATLELPAVSFADTANYSVVVTGICGTPATSNVVYLTVKQRPGATPSSNTPVCSGASNSITLMGGSALGTTFSWTGPNAFTSTSQNPIITPVAMNTGGSYRFIATLNGCSDTATTAVVVNPSPTAITITPSSPSIGYGVIQQLTAAGGSVDATLLNEDFNGTPSGWTVTNTSTGGDPTLSPWMLYLSSPTFKSNDSTNFVMTNSDAQGIGGITQTELYTPVMNSMGYESLSLSFWQFYQYWNASDLCLVEVSTDGGASWLSPALLTQTGANVGTQTAFVHTTIDMSAYINVSQLQIRFNYHAVWGYYWAIDNVSITGLGSSSIAWTPTDSLFTDAAATIPYTGATTSTVYAKPSATTTYTATATTLLGCSSSGSALVTVSCLTPTLIPASNVIGNTTAKLYWSSSSYNFEIECVPASASFTGVANYTLMNDYNNPHSLLLTSLAPGTDYKYQIRGECGSGYFGSWSAEGTFTTLAPQGTWTGLSTTTNNWDDATNWSGNIIPLNTDNVIIPASAPRWPHVNITPAECNDLTITPGGYLFVDAGKALTVNGLLINLAGASHFVLMSTYAGTASLLHMNAGVNAIVERSIHNEAADEFHMLGSPVAEQAIDPEFNEADGFFAWNEGMSEWVAFADVTNFTAVNGGLNFVPGLGYAVSYPSLTYPGDVVKTFFGELNQGPRPVTLSSTMGSTYEGWNFVSNPYPSTIDWDNLGFTRTALEDLGDNNFPMWIWNANLGAYGSYLSNTADYTNGLSSSMIPLGQGFWVKVFNPAGEFGFDNSVRTHSAQGYYKSTTASTDRIRLKVSGTANSYSDEILVKFGNASDLSGAEKMNSMYATAPNLYSTKLNKNWSINYLNTIAQHSVVPVSFKAGVNANYTIHASELNSFATTTYVYLKDLFTNTITDLNQNSTYNFASSVTDNANRFQLIFALSPLSVTDNVIENTSIYSNNYSIYINSNETIKQIAIYNTLGQLIKTVATTNGMTVVNMKENAAGYYLVKVVTNKNVYSEKVLIK